MKKFFFLFAVLCFFSCGNTLQKDQALKNLKNNPNWEVQDFWGALTSVNSKPIREIFFSISVYPGEITLTMPVALPPHTTLQIQFDENPPQAINMTNEVTADLSGMANEFFRAESATLKGDLFNIGMEETVTIPVGQAREAVQELLILSQSQKSPEEWLGMLRINTADENYPQNNWWWTQDKSAFNQQKELAAWFRSPAQLMQDLYFFPFIAVCNRFLWEKDSAVFVQIARTQTGLDIKTLLEFADPTDAGPVIAEGKPSKLLLRARADRDIVQTSLSQIDNEGRLFDAESLWPYLQKSQELTIRWWNKNHDPQTTYTYLKGLEYRLAQAYGARWLMSKSAAHLLDKTN